MDATIFQIGPIQVRWYGVMMAAGFFLALFVWTRLGKRSGFDSVFCSDLLIWVMLSGVLGARVAYVLSEWRYFAASPLSLLHVWEGGLVYYGGFIGSGIALFIFARRRRIPFFELVDLVVPGLAMGHAAGRVGCFINHCCYGSRSTGALSVIDPSTGFHVHPVQLYEAGLNMVIFAGLFWLYPHRKRQGDVVMAYLFSYPVVRFCLEFLRGDERLHAAGLTLAQNTSIAFIIVGFILLLSPRRAVSWPTPRSP